MHIVLYSFVLTMFMSLYRPESSWISWNKFFNSLDFSDPLWDTSLECLEKKKSALVNFHHIPWSKKVLQVSHNNAATDQGVLDLHGTDLHGFGSIKSLALLLPLGAATIKTLNMR